MEGQLRDNKQVNLNREYDKIDLAYVKTVLIIKQTVNCLQIGRLRSHKKASQDKHHV